MAVVKVQLPDDQGPHFELLAGEAGLARQVRGFMEGSAIQQAQIEAGLKALEEGDYASGDELSAIVTKYCKFG